jgi:pyruvate-formate lyase-activating enzyme
MLNSIQGFHIETTNICTLKCPRCSRTKFIEQFPGQWKNQQLNLDDLIKFIDIPLTNKKFELCGDYGDPIYYDRLFELVKWIKENGASIFLHTNGSYKTKAWWEELTYYMDHKDCVVFGIDGVPENFTNYRINADWNSIKVGIEVTTKTVNTVWQYIPFRYNIDYIDKAEQLSKELGFTEFKILQSSRWDGVDDTLRPDKKFIQSDNNQINFQKKNNGNTISPKCKITNNEHFITSAGFYAPCCYIPNHNFYYKTEFYKNKNFFDISKTTLTQVLENTETFFNSIEDTKPIHCIYHCPKL